MVSGIHYLTNQDSLMIMKGDNFSLPFLSGEYDLILCVTFQSFILGCGPSDLRAIMTASDLLRWPETLRLVN